MAVLAGLFLLVSGCSIFGDREPEPIEGGHYAWRSDGLYEFCDATQCYGFSSRDAIRIRSRVYNQLCVPTSSEGQSKSLINDLDPISPVFYQEYPLNIVLRGSN